MFLLVKIVVQLLYRPEMCLIFVSFKTNNDSIVVGGKRNVICFCSSFKLDSEVAPVPHLDPELAPEVAVSPEPLPEVATPPELDLESFTGYIFFLLKLEC